MKLKWNVNFIVFVGFVIKCLKIMCLYFWVFFKIFFSIKFFVFILFVDIYDFYINLKYRFLLVGYLKWKLWGLK